MTKSFCDCCGKETKSLVKMTYLCHLEDLLHGNVGKLYIDGEQEFVSGRSIIRELCRKCYNRIMIESVKKFESLTAEHANNAMNSDQNSAG